MKEKILSNLKTKFGVEIDEKTLSRIAEKLADSTAKDASDEEIKKVSDSVTFKQVMESYADSRVTDATKTASVNAVKDYEKKHGLKDGKKVDTPAPPKEDEKKKSEDETPDWAKQLIEDNKALKERIANMDAEKLHNSRKTTFDAAIKDLPQSYKQSLGKNFARMSFKDDDDFKNYVEVELKADIEAIEKEAKLNGTNFGRPKGGGAPGSDGVSDALKRRAEALKKTYEEANNAPKA